MNALFRPTVLSTRATILTQFAKRRRHTANRKRLVANYQVDAALRAMPLCFAAQRSAAQRGIRTFADASQYTWGDSDLISFHIYASWSLPPSCGEK